MVGSPLQTALEIRGALVLDGAMATELERHGADLSGGLWSARLLLERPELISRVHRDYFEAGADVAITASYQASVLGFSRLGLSAAEARRLMQSSVQLAVRARDEFWATRGSTPTSGPTRATERAHPVVATSIGPYGAVLADGSEYRGDYGVSFSELVRFHRERLEVLADAGVEVLACETIPSLVEARALVEAISSWPDITAWVSFSARNDREVSDGTPVAECAAYLDEQQQVIALGVNCTAAVHVMSLVQEVANASRKPIVVYPNSGEVYDATDQRWHGTPSGEGLGDLARDWYAAGARLIGGCCRTRPADIRAVSDTLSEVSVSQPPS